jgi:hypothetical protein
MKLLPFILPLFISCANLQTAIPEFIDDGCLAAPYEINISFEEVGQSFMGYLQFCQLGEDQLVCAYGFVLGDAKLCYHVITQTARECKAEWQYNTTLCPTVESDVRLQQVTTFKELTWQEVKNPVPY